MTAYLRELLLFIITYYVTIPIVRTPIVRTHVPDHGFQENVHKLKKKNMKDTYRIYLGSVKHADEVEETKSIKGCTVYF